MVIFGEENLFRRQIYLSMLNEMYFAIAKINLPCYSWTDIYDDEIY